MAKDPDPEKPVSPKVAKPAKKQTKKKLKFPKPKIYRSTKNGGAFWISYENYKLLRQMDVDSACVFMTLARFTGKDGKISIAGYPAIADRLGLSNARIGEILQELSDKNLIASRDECLEFSSTVREEILEHVKVHTDCKEIILQHYKHKDSLDKEFKQKIFKYIHMIFDLEEKKFPEFHESVNGNLRSKFKFKYINPKENNKNEKNNITEKDITWVLNNEHSNYIPSIWFGNSLIDGSASNKYPLKEILRSSSPSNIFKTLLFCYYNNNVVENRVSFIVDDFEMEKVYQSNGYSFYVGEKTDTIWGVHLKLDENQADQCVYDIDNLDPCLTELLYSENPVLSPLNPPYLPQEDKKSGDVHQGRKYLNEIAPVALRDGILNFLVKYGYLNKAIMVFNSSLVNNRDAMAMYELDIKDPENRMRAEKRECVAGKIIEVMKNAGIRVKTREDGKLYDTYYAMVPDDYKAHIHGVYRLEFMPTNAQMTPMRNGKIARQNDRQTSREWLEDFIMVSANNFLKHAIDNFQTESI